MDTQMGARSVKERDREQDVKEGWGKEGGKGKETEAEEVVRVY